MEQALNFTKTYWDCFWSKVNKTDTCWLWTGSLDPKGYGRTNKPDSNSGITAHRTAWLLTKGPVPEGLQVLHRCDVRHCVRPSHLCLGTNADNVEDRVSKGRSGGVASLEDALKVATARKEGATIQALAKQYNCSCTAIYTAVRRAEKHGN